MLTQPPLDWPAFEAWMDDVTRRRLHQAAQLLIGFPALTSAGGVAFWAALCGAPRNAEVRHSSSTRSGLQCCYWW